MGSFNKKALIIQAPFPKIVSQYQCQSLVTLSAALPATCCCLDCGAAGAGEDCWSADTDTHFYHLAGCLHRAALATARLQDTRAGHREHPTDIGTNYLPSRMNVEKFIEHVK